MSASDIQRWNSKYARYLNPDEQPGFIVDDLLCDHEALFAGEGSALDIAAGVSGNALWLASRGYRTTAVDGSGTAMQLLAAEALARELDVITVARDLDDYKIEANSFDVICVFRFLERGLFADIARALKPGGLLVYQTFNANHLQSKPGFNPDYVLAFNELNEAFPGLEVVINDQTANSTRYIGRQSGPA